ncbi:chromosome partition protein MukB [Sorangium sp. So ce296]|uniref:chromosome partition protein MukB n=1 Tax=Sorangium sp. So ce296 TaxID=3133296 RepID=UPI003F5E5CDF
MKRVQAAALALVNWRGVFCRTYDLDPNVTALEGTNGAGKTTVMIAAYVVLLPDMSRLRFTNLGEHGATGGDKGIWGRLGDPGRPSYAFLDLRLPRGERLLAGVHLERRAEPTVEPTPLIVTDLAAGAALEDVLLDRGELDMVPDLGRLREIVARAGARLTTFTSAREYFAALFDRGVTPLRLATEEERGKLNELLRTSMTGGISRALTSELRGFLLREETGLADTLVRMRQNLDACRRTRQEVEAARRTEGEIREVYDAGQRMLAAAVHATKEAAEERAKRLDEARRALAAAESERGGLEIEVDDGRARRDVVRSEHAAVEAAGVTARGVVERTRRAREIDERIRERTARREEAAARQGAARAAWERAEGALGEARLRRDEAREDRERAARGLSDLQRGIEELARRAAAHRIAVASLEEAARRLPGEDVRPETAGEVIARCEARQEALDEEIVRLDRELGTAARRRREFAEVAGALGRVVGAEVPAAGAYERASQAIEESRRLLRLVEERPRLAPRLDEARAHARRQRAARAQADALSAPDRPLSTAADVAAAHRDAEDELRDAEERSRDEAEAARDAEAAREAARARARDLEALAIRWREVRTAADALSARAGQGISSRDDLETLRAALQTRRDEVRRGGEEAEARRRALQDEALRLEQAGGQVSRALLRARDLVGGELLAGRFEEVALEDAAAVEALLGPLHEAILVDDARGAAEVLAQATERPATVWLLGGDAPLALDEEGRPPGELLGRDALVRSAEGVRLTRLPERPTLGRRARSRRVRELKEEERERAERVEALRAEERGLDRALDEVARLLPDAAILERDDPRPELGAAREAGERAAEAARAHGEAASAARARAQGFARRTAALTRLLPEAWLLEARDFDAEAAALAARLAEAQRAEAELARTAPDRRIVEGRIEVLRAAPPSDDDLARMGARKAEAERARDEAGRALLALRRVEENRAALAWTDAEAALRRRRGLTPALSEQLDRAKQALDRAEERLDRAEAAERAAHQALQAADGAVGSLDEALARHREELAGTGVEDPSAAALERAERELAALEERRAALSVQERELSEEVVRREVRLDGARGREQEARRHAEDEERLFRPAQERWERLRGLAEAQGALASALSARFSAELAGAGSPNLWPRAREHGALLLERLGRAQDGAVVAAEIKGRIGSAELTSGEAYLEAWQRVRDWLLRRIPPQIAEVDDPIEALARLCEHLARLQDRLARQEGDLRGESSDVARNIETQIRKAQHNLRRMTEDLDQVRFGNIHGVQVRVQRVARMDQVLQALKEDPAQDLLFKTSMPIEEALEELFRRHAGGRTGGQRLLDYREYMDLRIEVRRQASATWELANPSQLSTGEAIGVGAAIMMVVLAAWERDANLLRGKRSLGTLRLLFLDEATRLSQDSLDVLFDLCRSLELQLLIAAPEVARAEGNTTYRLVRRVDERGREEVLVTGRRVARELHG